MGRGKLVGRLVREENRRRSVENPSEIKWNKGPNGHFIKAKIGDYVIPFELRCQAKSKGKSREIGQWAQCHKWAIKGERFCQKHHRRRGSRKGFVRTQEFKGSHLASIYTRRATVNFQTLLDELEKAPPEERLRLASEIDVTRAACERAVLLFSRACFPDSPEKDTASVETKLAVQKMLHESMEYLSKLVERYTKIMAISEASISIEHLAMFREQMARAIIGALMPEHEDLVEKVLAAMKAVRLPEKQKASVQISIT